VNISEGDNGTAANIRRDKDFHFIVVADSGSLNSLSIDNDTLGDLSCSDGEVAK